MVLPDSLDRAVLAVARQHFPDVPERFLKLIAARAMQSEGYLKNVGLCVKRARFLAGERGYRKPGAEKLQDRNGPGTPLPFSLRPRGRTRPPRRGPSARAMPPACRPSAEPVRSGFEAEFPRRRMLPNAGVLAPALAS